MSEQYLGEIRLFANNYAPTGWALCNGQVLSIQQNQALFSLLGTMYGGNGTTTFALPDLRGRVPVHFGTTYSQGTAQGEENHTLTVNEMPAHNHLAQGSTAATSPTPTGNVWGTPPFAVYGPASALTTMNPASVSSAGANQPHPNMQPFLAMNFCIALQGIYPSRS